MRRLLFLLITTLIVSVNSSAQDVKNIIFLIGDGMGLSAASMMQIENNYEPTIFDLADNVVLTKTYSTNNRVTDSAAAGTALACGAKTDNTVLGLAPDGRALTSLTALASEHGKATGLIATTYLQHATPASFYAHVANRNEYLTITEQLTNSHIDVAIGGGMAFYREKYGNEECVEEALNEQGFTLLDNLEELREQHGNKKIMALLSDYEVGANSGSYLADATREAIRLLTTLGNNNGFVLMVEGSLIDGMAHGNNAKDMQIEMLGFMEAVEVAVAYAREHSDTLVVVTADHETGGLTIVSGDANFRLSEQGIEYCWSTGGHAGAMVPAYLYGTGAELINGVMENSELGAKLKALIE